MISEIVGVFKLLKDGVELAKEYKNEKIDIQLKVKNVIGTEQSPQGNVILAFIVITNKSNSPQSVTDVAINLGKAKVMRVPIKEIESPNTTSTMLNVHSHAFTAFVNQEVNDFFDYRLIPRQVFILRC